MNVLLTAAQMQQMDRLTIDEVGIPAIVLMEVAGRVVFEAALTEYEKNPGSVLVLSGTGNNGGDAVVAARHLKERGVAVDLVVLGNPSKASLDLQTQLSVAGHLGVVPVWLSSGDAYEKVGKIASDASVVIDGLFGTGLTRPITGWRAQVIDALNAASTPVISVDIPSGISADTGAVLGTAIRAKSTVTFQFAKQGHALYPGRSHTGRLVIADIGIPPSLLSRVASRVSSIEHSVLTDAFTERYRDSHKGTYGHLLVVAGAPDRPGAALLTSRAALRAGAGLVTLASDSLTIGRTSSVLDELMGLSVGDEDIRASLILDALAHRTALVIGPSLSPGEALKALLQEVLMHSTVPAVIDAGALVSLGTDWQWLKDRTAPTVLTPHPKEMACLMGTDTRTVQSDRISAARDLAEAAHLHVVLKGASTLVADPTGQVAVELGGNPGMATGGTGDVLAGIVGGLLAQGLDPFLAARAGVHVHAAAGDLAALAKGEASLIASDIIDHLPHTLRGSGLKPS